MCQEEVALGCEIPDGSNEEDTDGNNNEENILLKYTTFNFCNYFILMLEFLFFPN